MAPCLAAALWLTSLAGCPASGPAESAAFEGPPLHSETFESGVRVDVVHEGDPGGRAAVDGDRVELHYRLLLTDGTQVDASRAGKPLSFLVGGREVIDGMHPAVRGMRPGDRRVATIPPKQGYGGRAMGRIPPDSTLVFHLEMVAVHSGAPAP